MAGRGTCGLCRGPVGTTRMMDTHPGQDVLDRRLLREGLSDALVLAWTRISEPGTWWTGAERIAIAQEARTADLCMICVERREHLVRTSARRGHNRNSALPDWAIVATHDIRNDQARLSSGWYRSLQSTDGASDEKYVELLSIVALVTAIDTFDLASGNPLRQLPRALNGSPSLRRPPGAAPGLAWMPTLAPDNRRQEDPDLYQEHPGPRKRGGGNIHLALSLVPSSMMHWWDLFEKMYMSSHEMRDFTREYRAISHAQIEFAAARVAALNQCFY